MQDFIFHKLDKNLTTNDKFYFFTLLNNRFDILNDKLATLLSERFGKNFEPIYVLSAEPNKFYKKKNYVVLNKSLAQLRLKTGEKKFITMQDFEDLNIEFKKSSSVKKIIIQLRKKQGQVFVYSFTSFGLNFGKDVKVIGTESEIVEKYDNKIEQIKLFKKLSLPVIELEIFKTFNSIKKSNFELPYFFSPSYTSGAAESAVVTKKDELDALYEKLRPINKNSAFFIAKYMKNVVISPNTTAVVCGKNDTRMLCISDQILRGTKHLGNIYPSKASPKSLEIISQSTIKVGNYLSKLGFRGLFGCDYIIDEKDNCYIVDLNPRRQGGYLMVYLMSDKYNLLDIELKLAMGEKIPDFKFEDFQKDIVWAHSKLTPHEKYKRLTCEFKNNCETLPFDEIGKSFCCTFFPPNSILGKVTFGYYIVTGKNYEKVLSKTIKDSEKILSDFLVKN